RSVVFFVARPRSLNGRPGFPCARRFLLARHAAAGFNHATADDSAGPSSPRSLPRMAKKSSTPTKTKTTPPAPPQDTARVHKVLEAGEGILRLAPTWVPRSFLMPGRRIKLAPQDVYALGAHRGGIDERWFASTTAAANEGAPDDEGLSYVVHEGKRVF